MAFRHALDLTRSSSNQRGRVDHTLVHAGVWHLNGAIGEKNLACVGHHLARTPHCHQAPQLLSLPRLR